MTPVTFEVNGTRFAVDCEPRMLLADLLRDQLHLSGTHLGCEHGVCGSCTVQMDGKPARSCLTLAVQADGAVIRTVEDLASADGTLHPLQSAFHEQHALQCGFCTPGFLMSIEPLLPDLRGLSEGRLREQLAGNLCRCTGYQNIVDATQSTISGLGDPRRVILEHELPGMTWAQLAGARAAWRADAANFSAVVELLDLDDDERVAHFDIRGTESDGPGQVRGTARVAANGSGVAVRAELDFLGTATVPDREELRTLLTTRAGSIPRAAPALRAERRGGPAPWGLMAAAVAAWLIWHAFRKRR